MPPRRPARTSGAHRSRSRRGTGVKFSFPLGAGHSTELQYVFGKVPLLDITPSFKPDQFALSAQMMGYWTRFAATGNPNGGAAPQWPRFAGATPQLQELIPKATAPETEAVFAGFHQCAFWATIEGQVAPR